MRGAYPVKMIVVRFLRSEPGVRQPGLWRKGCFGTHSAAGSRFVERLLTVAAPLKRQQRNVGPYVRSRVEARARPPGVVAGPRARPPGLLQDPANDAR